MPSPHAVKYRPRPKSLSAISEERIQHTFQHRIYVPLSETRVGYIGIFDSHSHESHNGSPGTQNIKNRIRRVRSAPYSTCQRTSADHPQYRSSIVHQAPRASPCSRPSALETDSDLEFPSDLTTITYNAPSDTIPEENINLQGSPLEYARYQQESQSYPIHAGSLPSLPAAESSSVYHPMAPQQLSNTVASHFPRRISASHVPRGMMDEVQMPDQNYSGISIAVGVLSPDDGSEIYNRTIPGIAYNPTQSTYSPYSISEGNNPNLQAGSSRTQQSYNSEPRSWGPNFNDGFWACPHPSIASAPAVQPSISLFDVLENFHDADSNPYDIPQHIIDTTHVPPSIIWPFDVKRMQTLNRCGPVHDGFLYTYQQGYLANTPTDISYGSCYGQDAYLTANNPSTALGPTLISSVGNPSISMENIDVFVPKNELNYDPQQEGYLPQTDYMGCVTSSSNFEDQTMM